MNKLSLYSFLSKNGYISSSGLDDMLPSLLTLEATVGITSCSLGTITSHMIGPSWFKTSSMTLSKLLASLTLIDLIP